jgi:hypothetical protein
MTRELRFVEPPVRIELLSRGWSGGRNGFDLRYDITVIRMTSH